MPESPADERRAVDYLTAGHVDGALLVSLHENDPLPARLAAAGVPIVMVGRPPHGSQASFVDADNRQGAHAAVAHLIASGRRVIATITGPLDTAPGLDRLQGYRDALAEAGLALTARSRPWAASPRRAAPRRCSACWRPARTSTPSSRHRT